MAVRPCEVLELVVQVFAARRESSGSSAGVMPDFMLDTVAQPSDAVSGHRGSSNARVAPLPRQSWIRTDSLDRGP